MKAAKRAGKSDMMERSDEPKDISEARPHETAESLTPAGMAALQGNATDALAVPRDTAEVSVIGNPVRDAQYYKPQEYPGTCAVVAQEGIIAKHKGADPGESTLRQEAIENAWLANPGTPNEGTVWPAVGNLLETHNVPVARWDLADTDVLRAELANGHDVIAGVDAGELWQDTRFLGSGHAVWITGMELDSKGSPSGVYINDSGNPDIDGGGRVSMEVFQDAWDAAGRRMVSTIDSALDSRAGARR